MFRIAEKDGDTHIFSVVNKKLLCVIRDSRKLEKNGLTYVDTQIVSVHDSIKRREILRHKADLLAKKNEFPVYLPRETAPLNTKSYYMSGFGLQPTKSNSKRSHLNNNHQRQPRDRHGEEPLDKNDIGNHEQPTQLATSKTFFEDVPFSSNLGRRILQDRQSSTCNSEFPRYERFINRKYGTPIDCITYPYVHRGSEYPQPTLLRTYLFGKRPKGEYILVKKKRLHKRCSRRS